MRHLAHSGGIERGETSSSRGKIKERIGRPSRGKEQEEAALEKCRGEPWSRGEGGPRALPLLSATRRVLTGERNLFNEGETTPGEYRKRRMSTDVEGGTPPAKGDQPGKQTRERRIFTTADKDISVVEEKLS